MQAASTVQVTVRHFGVWNGALCVMEAIVLSVAAAWLWTSPDAWPSGGVGLLGVLAGGGVWAALTLLRWRPITLRWDTQRWSLAGSHQGADTAVVVELRVVLDLGGWMLLKCRADGRARCDWIPLQRRGLEQPWQPWQPLRCALYAHGGPWVPPAAEHGFGQGGFSA